jgi:hypothetical protein
MYTQPEINSFDQLIWRSERQKLYKRISDFCRQHNQELVHGRFDKEPSKIVKGFYLKEKYS